MSASRFAPHAHRIIVVGAAATLAAGTFVVTNLAGAASGPSAVDYAQCANGAPVSGQSEPTTCTGGWINGILNANNSQYREDQVVPQRLMVAFPDTASGSHTHTVTLRYLDRKATSHAYDYLATYNDTMTSAGDSRCTGVPYAGCNGLSGPLAVDIPADTDSLGPAGSGVSTAIADHMGGYPQSKRQMVLFGATPVSVSVPTHDCVSPCTGDDYASVTVTFTTPANSGNAPETHYVQILFGGHLAAGQRTVSQTDGWGVGFGAASISGGPYHIKWDLVDGASPGNRDNQIMSSAIIAIVSQGVTMSTTASPSSAAVDAVGNVSDSATLLVASAGHPPTGTEVFDLYGPFSSQPASTDTTPQCVDPDSSGAGGNRVAQLSTTSFTQDTTVLTKFTASSGNFALGSSSTLSAGWYQWVAHYVPGTDLWNLASDGACYTAGEQIHVTQATPAATSSQTITDTVHVTGFGTPSGHVSYFIFTDCANQATSLVWSDVYDSTKTDADPANVSNTLSGTGYATSDPFNAATNAGQGNGSTTYYWKVTYGGDTNNASGVVEPCGTQQFSIQNHP